MGIRGGSGQKLVEKKRKKTGYAEKAMSLVLSQPVDERLLFANNK